MNVIPVRCCDCKQVVNAEVQRAGRAPIMLRHRTPEGVCPASSCEPVGAAAEREQERLKPNIAIAWGQLTSRIARPPDQDD